MAALHQPVDLGSVIVTGPTASMRITLATGEHIDIGPGQYLVIEENLIESVVSTGDQEIDAIIEMLENDEESLPETAAGEEGVPPSSLMSAGLFETGAQGGRENTGKTFARQLVERYDAYRSDAGSRGVDELAKTRYVLQQPLFPGEAAAAPEPSSSLYLRDPSGRIIKLSESDLFDAAGNAVDITAFLNGGLMLVGYTIPVEGMTLADLFDYTTMMDESCPMNTLPMFSVNGGDASMVDMGAMFVQMMEAMGGMTETMPFADQMMGTMASMMDSFMSGMFAMPLDAFMQMMQSMSEMMASDQMMSPEDMATLMAQMMQEAMQMMPIEAFITMMNGMADTASIILETSDTPFEDIANMMGDMMLGFMQEFTGTEGTDAIADFGGSMGAMVQQFMLMMTGGSEDPAAAMGDMMGMMMSAMMGAMSGGSMISMEGFSSMMSGMMEEFTSTMASGMEPMAQMVQTMMSGMESQMALFGALFDQANEMALSMIEQSPEFLAMAQQLSDQIGESADAITAYALSDGDMPVSPEMLADYASQMNAMMAMMDLQDLSVRSSEAFMQTMAQMQRAADQMMNASQMMMEGMLQELPSTLYVQLSDGTIIPLSESDIMNADALSVDITALLGGAQLLQAYTIPNSGSMSVSDLLTMTTMTPEAMCEMMQLPMFDSASMLEMMTSMMDAMGIDAAMATMMDMGESMMAMMQAAMTQMPVEQFADVMTQMMARFESDFVNSDDPFVDMANMMGSMMYEFMDGMTGNESTQPAQDLALYMGEMVRQFMAGMTGTMGMESDPAEAMGDMMGSMMASMMNAMTGMTDAENPMEAFAQTMDVMMSEFMGAMSDSMMTMMDPMLQTMTTMLIGMDGSMEMMASMFETMNATAQQMIQASPAFLETMLALSDDIGAMADRIVEMGDGVVDTQALLSTNFLASQEQMLTLIETMIESRGDIEVVMGSDAFAVLMSNMQSAAETMGSMVGMDEMLPSNLYVMDAEGMMSVLNESDLLDEMGMSADITPLLGGQTMLMGYTIPTTQMMTLEDLFAMTTLMNGAPVGMGDLPMIPVEMEGMTSFVSVDEMSIMMTNMMTLFLGGGMMSADGEMLDMAMMQEMMGAMMDPEMMQNMLEPFMAMMQQFTEGVGIEAMMPLMEEMAQTFMDPAMMAQMAGMMESMMGMMTTAMAAMPVEEFGSMMGVMMETFSEQIITSDDPFVDMANTMGSMMLAFMDGMTGNDSAAPAQEFARTMGEMINQFMVGLTGSAEDPAQMLGDMMGSMMGAMMTGMTGDAEAPLQSFADSMTEMMTSFMDNAATNMVAMMDPMAEMMANMMGVMDGNMAIMASMFDQANETAQMLILQSPEYIATMLRLSDDIGAMADRIGDMADNIVETQVLQSPNFLATQENALELMQLMLTNQDAMLETMQNLMATDPMIFAELFGTLQPEEVMASMMMNLQGATETFEGITSANPSEVLSTLYLVDSDGIMTQISEADLMLGMGMGVDISTFLDGRQLLVGYTVPTGESMSLADLMTGTTLIDEQFAMAQLPMFSLEGMDQYASVMDMSGMLNQMMSLFLGGTMTDASGMPVAMPEDMQALMAQFMDPEMMSGLNMGMMLDPALMAQMSEPFMAMMNAFMGSMDAMPTDIFGEMMMQMMEIFMESGMADSMASMATGMMEMMSSSMGAMPLDEFGAMMGVLMDTFSEDILMAENPFDAMANTMGSMMLAFMDGMTGNDSEAPAEEFARTMGEMIREFMVGLTGSAEEPAAVMGDMMGNMMGAMMAGMTGNDEAPLQSFVDTMTGMAGTLMTSMAQNIVLVMDPMSEMMQSMMGVMDGNMEIIASMFDSAAGTAEMLIDMSPEYIAAMLRLSDDIGAMADRIGEMADNIVETQIIQSPNFLATQENALELIGTLMQNSDAVVTMLTMMDPDAYAAMFGEMDPDAVMASILGNLEGSAEMLGDMGSTFQSLPSMLYVADETGALSMVSESDLTALNGQSVAIGELLNGDTLLAGYTIPNAEVMTLADLMNLTTLIDSQAFSMQELPMIPMGNDGVTSMMSINEFSAMMNTMMGMFMGSQFEAMDGMMPVDMESMGAMMDPFMSMMEQFMGGMDMEAMMPMMSAMMGTMMETFSQSGMMDAMAEMAISMMGMMNDAMGAMPMTEFGNMAGLMMDTFTEEILTGGNPFENMANTMGSMMREFMDGMTGNESPEPTVEFAETMGSMIREFMIGLTGSEAEPAAAMGEMMGSMMAGMMAGMTGDADAPLQSFAETMSGMMGTLMNDFATSAAMVMDPMVPMMQTFMAGIDGNMAFIEQMFNTADGIADSLIAQSPEYMTAILALSDDIGEMADRILEMADRIVETQEIQSDNFLATQQNALALMEMISGNEAFIINEIGQSTFDAMMANIESVSDAFGSVTEMFDPQDVFASELFVQYADADGVTVIEKISEAQLQEEGVTDISAFLDGKQLLVGYTVPNAQNMTLAQLIEATTIMENGSFDMTSMPMFPLATGDASMMDMSGMMETMMGFFMGSGSMDGMIDESMMAPFEEMMAAFSGGITDMPTDAFMAMMNEMMVTMMDSGMDEAMMEMSGTMMSMMTGSMGSMPIASFTNMMGSMMESFGSMLEYGDTPMDAMAHTMGAMMLEFMKGFTDTDSADSAQEFARTMGEMVRAFMVGVSGTAQEPAAEIGDMMGSMMASFMIELTGDPVTPMESFVGTMSTMMGGMAVEMSENMAIMLDPAAEMMNTFLSGIDGNMAFIASMFDTMNGTMQSMIELSPEYMATVLRLSDDIGAMADRIGEMADAIVETEVLQSTNFLATQENMLEMMAILNANAPEYEALLGDSFALMMENLGKVETTLDGMAETVSMEMMPLLPSTLYVQDMAGSLVSLDESEWVMNDGSVDITQLLSGSSMLVGYSIPMNEAPSLNDLMEWTTMIEGSGFTLEQLPMFTDMRSIADINTIMNMMLDAEMMSALEMPVSQFETMFTTYQAQLSQYETPFDAMAGTIGSMMVAFMGGMTQTDTDQTPLEFSQLMGEMVREFMIGVTGSETDPAAALGDMMGSMVGSFMSAMTLNTETPMTQFTTMMSDMMHTFSTSMTQSMLNVIDPMLPVMETIANGINGNLAILAGMFDAANGTIQSLIEQSPEYIDTMLRLSDDIGLMADRINEMADRIVLTQEILSPVFLETQANALEMMALIAADESFVRSELGDEVFEAMMANFTSLSSAMESVVSGDMMAPVVSSMLYLQTEGGELIAISEEQLQNDESYASDISTMLSGASLLVGYTIPSSAEMSFEELIASTTVVSDTFGLESLPVLGSMDPASFDMSEMMSAMMRVFMGSSMGFDVSNSMSAPFVAMVESFADGMGLTLQEFETMMNGMMQTMMADQMMAGMQDLATTMINTLSFKFGETQVDTFEAMMEVMMNTFLAEGSPLATMADMMGSMMTSLMAEVTPGENDTITDMAYRMGEMMQAFFVGVTGEQDASAEAMATMMNEIMTTFMESVTGEDEAFSDVMNTMMERFIVDMQRSFETIIEPMRDSIDILLDNMDANMAQIGSMLASFNETVEMALDLSPEYMEAMNALGDDVLEMAGRIDEMIDKMADTQALQSDNLAATQENIQSLVDLLGTAGAEGAQDLMITQLQESLEDASQLLTGSLETIAIEQSGIEGYMLLDDMLLDYSTLTISEEVMTGEGLGVLNVSEVFVDDNMLELGDGVMTFSDINVPTSGTYYDSDANKMVIIPEDPSIQVQS
jgi:hypothetical protein